MRRALPLKPQESYLVEAFKVAVENNITVYDALFIVFVKKSGLELIMSDTGQVEVCR